MEMNREMGTSNMTHLTATFGVEIETYLPEGTTQQQACEAVNQRLGALGRCTVESYNHQVRGHWKIVTDGSLSDYVRGVEFVSPILRGEDGLKQVEVVCKALTDFGCTVNRRCGYHVHVGAAGMPLDFFKNIVKLYSIYEPVIDSLMPRSRRASTNMYCRSMTTANPARLDAARDFNQILTAATGTSAESRFYKLNLSAFRRHRTVEFRQHSGTLDAVKAVNWVVTCLKMVSAAMGPLALGSAPAQNQARPGSKAHRIGEMLLRPEGVSGREICREMNWPSVSIPAQARAAGLTVTSQRTGREVRYFARVAQAQAAAPITLDGFAQVIGATDDEKAYLTQRAADLSGSVQWAA
jgi:Putative amidoligase enzyme